MEKQGFVRRFFLPVLPVLAVASFSWGAYNLAWRLGSPALHHALAGVFGTLLFVSVTFGPMVVYPAAFRRGASGCERVAACFVTPFVWATKECVRMLAAFTAAESLYFYLNPLNIWLVLGITAQMSAIELILRRARKKRGEKIRVFSAGVVAALILSLALVVGLYAWGRGENIFSYYLVVYKQIFGPGAGLTN